MQNLGMWGIVGTGGSKYVVESAIFVIADPDLPIYYATFMGLQWWLRAVYSWVLSIFGRKKKTVSFWAKIWRFWGINRGLKLNLSFMTPKRYIIALLSVVPARPAVSPSIDQEPSFVHRTSAAATSCQDCLPRLLFLQSWQEVWLVLCYVIYDFTFFELSRVKIHPRVWPVGWSKKKGINKTQKFDFLDL